MRELRELRISRHGLAAKTARQERKQARSFCHVTNTTLRNPSQTHSARASHDVDSMPTQGDQLRDRFRRFAARIVKFARTLPRDPAADGVTRQLSRAGTGASANYHSACRGRSRAEFIARLGVALDEADEAERWLGVVKESGLARGGELEWLVGESGELRAILFASVTTARLNQRASLDHEAL